MAHTPSLLESTSQQSHRETNRIRCEDQAAHNWYRFVLSFPPHLVRNYLERFHIQSTETVLDPFCGTGTTLVECKKQGIPCIGIESNPVALFASKVKTDWAANSNDLWNCAKLVAQKTLRQLQTEGIEDVPEPPLFRVKHAKTKLAELKSLPREASHLLLRNSISPLPLHKTLTLLGTIDKYSRDRLKGHERLALAKTLVFAASNLEFGPEVGVGPAKPDASVVTSWLQEIHTMAEDLRALRSRARTKVLACCADARQLVGVLKPNSVDAVITSPPYPNEKDYTRTTRLESVLLGFVRSKDDLRALKRQLIRSNTRGVYKDDDDDICVERHAEISRIAQAIEKRRIEMQKDSGFERLYARVTRLYFGGMARHLASLRAILRPGARLAYVVGDQASYLRIMIRTGQILADIAASLGYEVVALDLFRTRLATATRDQLREEVLVLHWPGKKD